MERIKKVFFSVAVFVTFILCFSGSASAELNSETYNEINGKIYSGYKVCPHHDEEVHKQECGYSSCRSYCSICYIQSRIDVIFNDVLECTDTDKLTACYDSLTIVNKKYVQNLIAVINNSYSNLDDDEKSKITDIDKIGIIYDTYMRNVEVNGTRYATIHDAFEDAKKNSSYFTIYIHGEVIEDKTTYIAGTGKTSSVNVSIYPADGIDAKVYMIKSPYEQSGSTGSFQIYNRSTVNLGSYSNDKLIFDGGAVWTQGKAVFIDSGDYGSNGDRTEAFIKAKKEVNSGEYRNTAAFSLGTKDGSYDVTDGYDQNGQLILLDISGGNLYINSNVTIQNFDCINSKYSAITVFEHSEDGSTPNSARVTVNGKLLYNAGENGGAVKIDGGTVNVSSGSMISYNTGRIGGGVCVGADTTNSMQSGRTIVSNGILRLNGGTISHNEAVIGGGVALSCATINQTNCNTLFEFTYGEISNNRTVKDTTGLALLGAGGGVAIVSGKSEFKMTGGTMKKNSSANGIGNAVSICNYLSGFERFTFTGGTIENNISDNETNYAISLNNSMYLYKILLIVTVGLDKELGITSDVDNLTEEDYEKINSVSFKYLLEKIYDMHKSGELDASIDIDAFIEFSQMCDSDCFHIGGTAKLPADQSILINTDCSFTVLNECRGFSPTVYVYDNIPAGTKIINYTTAYKPDRTFFGDIKNTDYLLADSGTYYFVADIPFTATYRFAKTEEDENGEISYKVVTKDVDITPDSTTYKSVNNLPTLSEVANWEEWCGIVTEKDTSFFWQEDYLGTITNYEPGSPYVFTRNVTFTGIINESRNYILTVDPNGGVIENAPEANLKNGTYRMEVPNGFTIDKESIASVYSILKYPSNKYVIPIGISPDPVVCDKVYGINDAPYGITVYGTKDIDSNNIESYTVNGGEYLYAVWSYDYNANKIPDYLEEDYLTVRYTDGIDNTEFFKDEIFYIPYDQNSVLPKSSVKLTDDQMITQDGYIYNLDSTYTPWVISDTDVELQNYNNKEFKLSEYVSYIENKTLTLVPNWQIMLMITLDPNGGVILKENIDVPEDFVDGERVILPAPKGQQVPVEQAGFDKLFAFPDDPDIMFIGLTSNNEVEDVIYAAGDSLPANAVIYGSALADENNVTTITLVDPAVYYAVWAYDKNKNNIPDYKEICIIYKDGEDSSIFDDQIHFSKEGDETPVYTVPARPGYDFAGWSPQFSATVTGSATYTATWTPHEAIAPTVTVVKTTNTTAGTSTLTANIAKTEENHVYTYQWYKNSTNSTEDFLLIENATSETLEIPISTNTTYYYCKVTATRSDNGKTADVNSETLDIAGDNDDDDDNPQQPKGHLEIVFEKSVDENGDPIEKRGERIYDIIISASENNLINRFNSADLTFMLTSQKGKNAYEIIDISEDAIKADCVKDDRYEFHFETKEGVTNDTAQKIVLARVRFTGYGEFEFTVDADVTTNQAHATTLVDNLVDTYAPNGTLDGKTVGKLLIDKKIEDFILVPTQKLTINVLFPNSIENNKSEYQNMKITVKGNDIPDIVIDLGSDNKGKELDIDYRTAPAYTLNCNGADNSYTAVISDVFTANNSYYVTVSGEGYRTARYTVNMQDTDKVLNFWNNVKDGPCEIEVGNEASTKTKNFLAGDIVKDNDINIYDLSAVVSYFGIEDLAEKHPQYAKYDLNRDGRIDSRDVAYVLVSWGE